MFRFAGVGPRQKKIYLMSGSVTRRVLCKACFVGGARDFFLTWRRNHESRLDLSPIGCPWVKHVHMGSGTVLSKGGPSFQRQGWFSNIGKGGLQSQFY